MGVVMFEADRAYDNVYFLFIDAAGYSGIVEENPRDIAARAFDLLRECVAERLRGLATERGCARAFLWSWRGDGGCFAIHDDDESVALEVALEMGRRVLGVDLPRLQEEFVLARVRGELHVRMALHKGPLHYSAQGVEGMIHSPVINFAARLEKAAPRDCLAVSEDVYRVCNSRRELFELVGSHEGRSVYLLTEGRAGEGKRSWLRSAGLTGGSRLHAYGQRPSQREKARLVEAARQEVLDLGTALNTCSGYLLSTERPACYRDTVLDFLQRGGVYRCVLLDPESEAARIFGEFNREDLVGKIRRSIERFCSFKERYADITSGLHVYQAREFPGMSAICVDLESSDSLILFSPLLLGARPEGVHLDRGDMPHYLSSTESSTVHGPLRKAILAATSPSRLKRVV
ncbi:hypothetical protein ACSNOI_13965 [Actinomadura kijaniata]|uniref:hypothetical protein n=1 Tax=Actinomadura kijaniata TaxID=46161 RepID=UPI003F1CAFCD